MSREQTCSLFGSQELSVGPFPNPHSQFRKPIFRNRFPVHKEGVVASFPPKA